MQSNNNNIFLIKKINEINNKIILNQTNLIQSIVKILFYVEKQIFGHIDEICD